MQVSCRRSFLFVEDFAEDFHGGVHVSLGDDVGRKEAQHRLVRAVDQQAVRHGVQHHLLAGDFHLDADHEAEAAHFLYESVLARQFVEHHVQIAAHLLDGGQQPFQNVEEFERHAAGQRAAAEGRAVHARPDGSGGFFVGHDGSQREAACQRFGRHYDIRQHHRLAALICEIRAGTAYAALDLVEHQQGVVAVGQFARLPLVFGRNGIDAAFSLNQLQYHAGGGFAESRFQRCHIVGGHESDARQQRLEILAVFGLAGDGEGTQRAAVKGIIERDDFVLAGPVLVAVRPDHLQRAFHGLAATVSKEGTLEAAGFGQLFGQGPLVFVVVKIRGVDQQGGLLADHLDDAGMRVAQRFDADARDEVEVAGTIDVVNVTALSPVHDQWIAAVVLEQVLAFQIDNGVGGERRYGVWSAGHLLMIQRGADSRGTCKKYSTFWEKDQPGSNWLSVAQLYQCRMRARTHLSFTPAGLDLSAKPWRPKSGDSIVEVDLP